MRTVESDDWLAMYLKKGSVQMPCTYFLCPSNVYNLTNFYPTPHRIDVPSSEQDIKYCESFDQERPITSPTWPRI